jgi:hypothetical protein
VIKLRFFFNRTPQEIQHYMGITERVYRRELERASRTLADRFELVRDGTFCESQRSLMLAYVTGVAGPTRKLEARRHLDNCPGCTSWVLERRALTRRAAAAVPPPMLGLSLHHWLLDRIATVAHGTRERVSDLLSGARDQGIQTLLRSDASRVVALAALGPARSQRSSPAAWRRDRPPPTVRFRDCRRRCDRWSAHPLILTLATMLITSPSERPSRPRPHPFV